jgi:hypothetical protein
VYVNAKARSRQPVGSLRNKDGHTVIDNMEMVEFLNTTFGAAFTREQGRETLEPNQIHEGEGLNEVKVRVKEIKPKLKAQEKWWPPPWTRQVPAYFMN